MIYSQSQAALAQEWLRWANANMSSVVKVDLAQFTAEARVKSKTIDVHVEPDVLERAYEALQAEGRALRYPSDSAWYALATYLEIALGLLREEDSDLWFESDDWIGFYAHSDHPLGPAGHEGQRGSWDLESD